jgi:hypothetical protein
MGKTFLNWTTWSVVISKKALLCLRDTSHHFLPFLIDTVGSASASTNTFNYQFVLLDLLDKTSTEWTIRVDIGLCALTLDQLFRVCLTRNLKERTGCNFRENTIIFEATRMKPRSEAQ